MAEPLATGTTNRFDTLAASSLPGTAGESHMKNKRQTENTRFVQSVGRALRRAAKTARKTAKMYGTPIYVWENGKVVAKKP
jgi:hypothetical protein